MKFEISVDDRIVRFAAQVFSKRVGRWVAGLGVIGSAAWAYAASTPHSFEAGQVLSAATLNENFQSLSDALTLTEQRVAALSGSYLITGNVIGDSTWSIGGYSYLTSDVRVVQRPYALRLPVGTQLTGLTCYFYNNSDGTLGSGDVFEGLLRRVTIAEVGSGLPTASAVANVSVAPPKSDGVQAFSADINPPVVVQEEEGYFVHMAMVANTPTAEEVYPAAETSEERRVMRHYGCRVHYELP